MPRTPITDESNVPTLFGGRERGNKTKCTNSEIELRRLEVVSRRLQGETITHIAKELGFSPVTIKNDIDAISSLNLQYVSDFSQSDFVGETLEVYRELEKLAFAQLNAVPRGDSRKAKFMQDIRSNRKAMIEILQDSGLLHKEPKKVDIAVSMEVLKQWSPEQKSLIAGSIIDAAMIEGEIITTEEPDQYAQARAAADDIDIDEIAEFSDD